jgi:hypothetical protein
MATANLFSAKKEIRNKLDEMITRSRSTQSFLAHCAYPMYIARQSKRWMSEGESEGAKWAPLSEQYKKWKKLNLVGMPGNGTKLLIATGKLFEGVTGRELKKEPNEVSYLEAGGKTKPALTGGIGGGGMPHHFAKITGSKLTVYTDVEYASDVNKARKIWFFKDDFKKRLKAMYLGWFKTGAVNPRQAK